MVTKTRLSILCFLLLAGPLLRAQVTVVSAALTAFNVTPASTCQVTLMNAQGETNVSLVATIHNSSGELLLEVRTLPFPVRAGVNVVQPQTLQFSSSTYAASPQGNFLQSQKQLPSGLFKHCVRVLNGGGEVDDEYCQDIEPDNNSFLSLVSPFDRDTIDSKTPVLTWTHSEPFNLLTPGESFRLVLVKLGVGQDPEAAVIANTPHFIHNNLFRHDLQYPFNAPALKEGETYAWQVQKMSAGGQGVIAKTEAWRFTVRRPAEAKDNKYSVLKKKPDAGYYLASNNKIFFCFDEAYGGGKIACMIYDERHKPVDPGPENEAQKEAGKPALEVKTNGYNRYEVDLDALDLKTGYYFLEVVNGKKEKYILKFYVE